VWFVWEDKGYVQNLVGKPLGKRPLERLKERGEENIRMDLREVGCEDRSGMELSQDRVQWRLFSIYLRINTIAGCCFNRTAYLKSDVLFLGGVKFVDLGEHCALSCLCSLFCFCDSLVVIIE